ncbi:MAG TPA: outer membrane beta-barrel protein [Gemmatimonadaceae bacterium]|jgi:opacity protein-like surface antigen
MRTITHGLAAAALATLAMAGGLHAQFTTPSGYEQPHKLRIGFGGGVDVPTSNAGDAFKNGVHGQAFLLVSLGMLPALRFNLGYSKFNLKDALNGGGSGDSRILSGTAGMKIDLLHGPVRPYVLAGVGAFNIKNTLTASDSTGSASETKFGVDGGAGLAFRVGRIDAFVEGRVQNVFTNKGVINASTIRTVPVSFGIIF